MIIRDKKLFFKTASVILEDDCLPTLIKSRKYSSIVVLSYNKLSLSGFSTYSKPTLLIDLRPEENEIFKSFNDTTRNEIRRTEKISNMSVEVGSKPDMLSYELYKKFEFSQGRVPVSFKSLSECIMTCARLEGEIVSGVYITPSKPYLRVRSIFSKRTDLIDKELYKTIGYATRRVIWESVLWGKKNGYISLDMASVNIKNPKTLSIAKFKMSFGKDLVPEYTYIYKSRMFFVFEKLIVFKLMFKKLSYIIEKLIK